MAAPYPTWVKIKPGLYHSEEQVDGTPDFIVEKFNGPSGPYWSVKNRVTQQWVSGFPTAGQAKEYAEALS